MKKANQSIFDSLISTLIGIMVIISSWSVVKSALHVLLEGIPEGIDIEKIKETITRIPLVKNIDDLHLWAISSHLSALSCHVVIEECNLEESTRIVKQVKEELRNKFNIEHATIETELIECPPENNQS